MLSASNLARLAAPSASLSCEIIERASAKFEGASTAETGDAWFWIMTEAPPLEDMTGEGKMEF